MRRGSMAIRRRRLLNGGRRDDGTQRLPCALFLGANVIAVPVAAAGTSVSAVLVAAVTLFGHHRYTSWFLVKFPSSRHCVAMRLHLGHDKFRVQRIDRDAADGHHRDWHHARHGFHQCRLDGHRRHDRLRNGLGQLAVDGQRDGRVPSAQHQSVGGYLSDGRIVGHTVQVDAVVLVVLKVAETLERRGARFAEVVDKELNVELGRIGGAQPDAARKVGLDARAQRYDAHLGDVDGFGELHQIEVEILCV